MVGGGSNRARARHPFLLLTTCPLLTCCVPVHCRMLSPSKKVKSRYAREKFGRATTVTMSSIMSNGGNEEEEEEEEQKEEARTMIIGLMYKVVEEGDEEEEEEESNMMMIPMLEEKNEVSVWCWQGMMKW